MKEIFIITSYYPPEIGAASNRIMHLAEGLQKLNFKITVVTPMPNYPTGRIFKEYRGKFLDKTYQNEVRIVRLWVFASNSKNKVKRFLAMLSYSISLKLFYCFNKIPKTVIVQSPPLLVAFTSMFWLGFNKRKLILNISDLWPTAGLELGAIKKGMALRVLLWMERFNYKNADLILGQSEEILTHVKRLFPEKGSFLYRNYPIINSEISVPDSYFPNNRINIVYAGLLGLAQGILELCKNMDFSKVDLHIYGDGAEKRMIEDYIEEHPQLPIKYHGNFSREKLHNEIVKYDFGIIPLRNTIYGSVPSKIFEYAFLGLPIIYFGGGEGESIVRNYNLGISIEAGSYVKLNEELKFISKSNFGKEFRERIRESAIENFNLKVQILNLTKYLQ